MASKMRQRANKYALVLFDWDGCTAVVDTVKLHPKFQRQSKEYTTTWMRQKHKVEVLETSDKKRFLNKFEETWNRTKRAELLAEEKMRRGDKPGGYLAVLPDALVEDTSLVELALGEPETNIAFDAETEVMQEDGQPQISISRNNTELLMVTQHQRGQMSSACQTENVTFIQNLDELVDAFNCRSCIILERKMTQLEEKLDTIISRLNENICSDSFLDSISKSKGLEREPDVGVSCRMIDFGCVSGVHEVQNVEYESSAEESQNIVYEGAVNEVQDGVSETYTSGVGGMQYVWESERGEDEARGTSEKENVCISLPQNFSIQDGSPFSNGCFSGPIHEVRGYEDLLNLKDYNEIRVHVSTQTAAKAVACSVGNFGWLLVQKLFPEHAIIGRNYSGKKGKYQLSPRRVHAIEHAAIDCYGDIACKKVLANAINAAIRNITRKKTALKLRF